MKLFVCAARIVIVLVLILTHCASPVTASGFPQDLPLDQALEEQARQLLVEQLDLDQVEHTLTVAQVQIENRSALVDFALESFGPEGIAIDEVIHVFALHDGDRITAIFREPSPDFYLYAGQVSTNLLPPERLQAWQDLRAEDLAGGQVNALGEIGPQAVSYYLPWATGGQYYVYQDWNKHFDFQTPVGTPVWASRGGTAYVYRASVDKNQCATPDIYNNYVRITHSDGTYGWYMHFKFGSIVVNTNDYINRGQLLAQSGNTGCSQAQHLHFNVSTTTNNAGGDPYGSAWIAVSFVEGAIPATPAGGKTPPSQNTPYQPTPPPNSVSVRPTLYYNNAVVNSPTMCGNYWYPINGAYITLNTNSSAQSTNYSQWSATLDKPGIYKVEAYIRNHPVISWQCPSKTISYDTADARYTIYTASGNVNVTGNQRPLSDSWLDLGNRQFNAGSAVRARLSDLNGEANSTYSISAHDMRFTLMQETCFSLSLTSNPSAGGTVTVSPAPNCNTNQYSYNTVVTLTAQPEDGYTFSGWSGSASGSNASTTVTMSANRSATAAFTQQCYSLSTTVTPNGSGTVNVSPAPNCNGNQYSQNTVVTLTAQPAAGYTFSGWSGSASGSNASTTVTMSANRSVTAAFARQCYAITTVASPTAGGVVEVSPAPNCGALYTHGTRITFTARPAAGYQFNAWSGKLSGTTNPAALDLTMPSSVVASFSIIPPAVPGGFNKVSPGDGAVDQPLSLLLDWTPSQGAVDYEYCYRAGPGTCSNWVSSNGASQAVLTALAPGVTYSWQVRAVNPAGMVYADFLSTNIWTFTARVPAIHEWQPRLYLPLLSYRSAPN